jgi:UDP-GlcNAc3NAcA epimerase
LQPKAYFLVTVHRAENTDDGTRLQSILVALQELSALHPVIWPVHPRARKALERHYSSPLSNHTLRLIDPVSYLDMLVLERHAKLILTDSGGLQKEACWFQVPCVTLRNETEWPETLESGWNVLAGSDSKRITKSVIEAKAGDLSAGAHGNGKVANRIVALILGGSRNAK